MKSDWTVNPIGGGSTLARGFVCLLVIGVGLLCAEVPAQNPPLPDPRLIEGSAAAVSAEIDVERVLLVEDLKRFDHWNRKRDTVTNRVSDLHRSLTVAVGSGATASPERIDELLAQVSELEAERAAIVLHEQRLVETIRDRRRRISLLLEQLETLQGLEPRQEGVMSGTWDIVFLPTEQRGVFSLHQGGTLISGTYRLDGGWTGSLQGTLVNRKVFLVRIDSKLGRVMELEGFLSAEEDRVRGSWLNYELAGSEGATGHWSAERRQTE